MEDGTVKVMSIDEVIEKRKDAAFDSKWLRWRRDRACGENQYKNEAIVRMESAACFQVRSLSSAMYLIELIV